MTFAGNENHITFLCHHTGCTDGLFSIDDAYYLLHLFRIKTCKHIVDDILRFLETRVVGGDNNSVTLFYSLLRHQWTLTLIAISSSSANGDYTALTIKYLMNGIQHILQGIWGVSIINDCCVSLWRTDGFKTAVDTLKCTHNNKYILWFFTKHHSCSIYSQKITYVELTYELYSYFMTVDFEIHTFKMAFDNLCLEICHTTSRVCLYGSLRILHHEHTIFIINVGNSKSVLIQTIKEGFFGITIVLEGPVIVEMVSGEICKQTAFKLESSNTFLGNGMTATLHECVFTSCIHHL